MIVISKRLFCFIILAFIIPQLAITENNIISTEEYLFVENDNSEIKGFGRLYIPSVDVNVALYTTANKDHKAQGIVDRNDSAAYRISHKGGCGFIADHWNQGFINIMNCELGCKCYIKTDSEIIIYECIKIINGKNDGSNLYLDTGEKLSNVHWADFVCYTCKDNWRNVFMVFFKKIE